MATSWTGGVRKNYNWTGGSRGGTSVSSSKKKEEEAKKASVSQALASGASTGGSKSKPVVLTPTTTSVTPTNQYVAGKGYYDKAGKLYPTSNPDFRPTGASADGQMVSVGRRTASGEYKVQNYFQTKEGRLYPTNNPNFRPSGEQGGAPRVDTSPSRVTYTMQDPRNPLRTLSLTKETSSAFNERGKVVTTRRQTGSETLIRSPQGPYLQERKVSQEDIAAPLKTVSLETATGRKPTEQKLSYSEVSPGFFSEGSTTQKYGVTNVSPAGSMLISGRKTTEITGFEYGITTKTPSKSSTMLNVFEEKFDVTASKIPGYSSARSGLEKFGYSAEELGRSNIATGKELMAGSPSFKNQYVGAFSYGVGKVNVFTGGLARFTAERPATSIAIYGVSAGVGYAYGATTSSLTLRSLTSKGIAARSFYAGTAKGLQYTATGLGGLYAFTEGKRIIKSESPGYEAAPLIYGTAGFISGSSAASSYYGNIAKDVTAVRYQRPSSISTETGGLFKQKGYVELSSGKKLPFERTISYEQYGGKILGESSTRYGYGRGVESSGEFNTLISRQTPYSYYREPSSSSYTYFEEFTPSGKQVKGTIFEESIGGKKLSTNVKYGRLGIDKGESYTFAGSTSEKGSSRFFLLSNKKTLPTKGYLLTGQSEAIYENQFTSGLRTGKLQPSLENEFFGGRYGTVAEQQTAAFSSPKNVYVSPGSSNLISLKTFDLPANRGVSGFNIQNKQQSIVSSRSFTYSRSFSPSRTIYSSATINSSSVTPSTIARTESVYSISSSTKVTTTPTETVRTNIISPPMTGFGGGIIGGAGFAPWYSKSGGSGKKRGSFKFFGQKKQYTASAFATFAGIKSKNRAKKGQKFTGFEIRPLQV